MIIRYTAEKTGIKTGMFFLLPRSHKIRKIEKIEDDWIYLGKYGVWSCSEYTNGWDGKPLFISDNKKELKKIAIAEAL